MPIFTKNFKTHINPLNISKIFFLLFLISLFFPIHYIFFGKSSIETGIYSDFTTITLYLSDILLILSLTFLLFSDPKVFYSNIKPLFWLILWVFVVFFANLDTNWQLSLFYWVKFTELIVAYGTIATLLEQKSSQTRAFHYFIALSSIQSIIALCQFYFQHSIGLFKLGEQKLNNWSPGIAKITLNNHSFIRGYGTFPHPNPLSAFLIIGILLSIYLLLQSNKKWQIVIYSLAILTNTLGLAVTFSRSAFLALGLGLTGYFGFMFYKSHFKSKQLNMTCLIVILSLLTSIIIFSPYLLTRATISDQAVVQRGIYNKIGLNIIENNPLFGVGPGLSVLHMQQFSSIKLWPWQIQPIHNYFLLSAAELGIPGALILLWIFLRHLWKLIKQLKQKNNFQLASYYLLLATVLVSFLILMQFDHYFYTLEQTQMLLWLTLGIIFAATKNPSNEGNS